MRIAVTGTTGRVGTALARQLSVRHEVIALPRPRFDLASPGEMAARLDSLECDVFLNPGGMTSLEACEDDPAAAMRANAGAPGEIAAWAASRGVRLIHFSTDYVFSGETDHLREENESPAPLSIYGRSKLAGEQAVLKFPKHSVIRVSWVIGPEKPSFVDKVIQRAMAGLPLSAIDDKFSLPTFTGDLCQWVEALLSNPQDGMIHACQSGEPASWHDLAVATADAMMRCGALDSRPEIAHERLEGNPGFRAARPRFTAMATMRLEKILGHPPRPWRKALAEYVANHCSALKRENQP